ncbi:hypothetical protein ACSS6W_002707 [Trichoderma asperelloides]
MEAFSRLFWQLGKLVRVRPVAGGILHSNPGCLLEDAKSCEVVSQNADVWHWPYSYKVLGVAL